MAIALSRKKAWLRGAVLLAAGLLTPLVIKDTYLVHLLIMSLVWGSVVSNWNLTLGFGGMFHIAQPTFFAVGAYGAAIACNSLGVSPWSALTFGGMTSLLAGVIIGLPSLRVKGIYLILLTFACHFALSESVFHFGGITGGSVGLSVPTYKMAGVKFSPLNLTAYYYMALILATVSILFTTFVIRSNLGKALIATRDSEVLAGCCGINIYYCKLVTFCASAFITGVVGAFYSSYLMAIGPELFSFSLIVNALGMMVIGGIGTIFGPVIGSFIITFLSEVFADMEVYRPIAVGVIIMLMLIFVPRGFSNQISSLLRKFFPDRKAAP